LDPEELTGRYPVLYHMAEDASWESIRRLGLLSTSALLDRFGVRGERRYSIESCRRPGIATVEGPGLGKVLIRDNKPMQEATLRRCLSGLTPREWYENLNRRVFFWVEWERLARLLGARANRDRPHLVLEVDTAGLLRSHSERIALSSINSGATFAMSPASRGPDTFRRIAEHPKGKAIVELAVDYSVPNIADLAISAGRWHGAEMLEKVWSPPAG
jgi:hypothetical protein